MRNFFYLQKEVQGFGQVHILKHFTAVDERNDQKVQRNAHKTSLSTPNGRIIRLCLVSVSRCAAESVGLHLERKNHRDLVRSCAHHSRI